MVSAVNLWNLLPNGVIRYSDVVEGVVETSLDIGVLKTEEDRIIGTILLRSLIESGREYVESLLRSLATLSGAQVSFPVHIRAGNAQRKRNFSLDRTVLCGSVRLCSRDQGYHAGLECGFIEKNLSELDVVSIGPTIVNAHSPDEKVHIPAVQTYWQLLTKLLANIPHK